MTERNPKSNQYSVAGLMAAALLVTLGVGCKKTGNPADTVTVVATDTPVAAIDTPTIATDPGMDDTPEHNPTNTRAYLARFNGHWATNPLRMTLECHKPAECAGHDSVHIKIYTHELTWMVNAARILAQNAQNAPGHIVTKIVNSDAWEFRPLGLGANDSVYLWVGKTDTVPQPLQPIRRHRAFAVFRIDQQGNATGVARAYAAHMCKGPPEPASSAADIRSIHFCEHGRVKKVFYDRSGIMPDSVRSAFEPFHDQGVWFACTGGCCQATTFGPY